MTPRHVLQVFEAGLPPTAEMYLTRHLADIEHHLSTATQEQLQLSAMVGAFALAREKIQREKQVEEKKMEQ